MRRRRGEADEGALALLDNAFHVLRRAPAASWVCFYAGSLPFVFGAIAFWMDMRRSAFAHRHIGEASLMLALLYVGMSTAHAVFARWLRASLTGAPPIPGATAWRRLALVQAGTQPWALFTLPASLLLGVPFGWVYAYFQGVSVTGDPAAARRQAVVWPYQNHVLIALQIIFGLFVFIDLAVSLYLLPALLKSLAGVETPFSRSPAAMLNSTFFVVACGLTYLVLTPLVKAVYVLRSYQIESMTTGEDLRVELRALPRVTARTTAALMAAGLAFATGVTVTRAAEPRTEPSALGRHKAAASVVAAPAPGVPPGALERAMREVIERREFRWRMPREDPGPQAGDQGLISRFVDSAIDTLGGWFGAAFDAIERLVRWVARRMFFRGREPAEGTGAAGWWTSVRWLLGALLILAAGLGAFFLWRGRGILRRAGESRVLSETQEVPTLGGEAAGAPPALWLQRAGELLDAGDLRGAMRATYLATLAQLSDQGLVLLERYKSNRDYLLEVRRRARDRPCLPAVFSESVQAFERVWYGRHPATLDLVRASRDRFERLRADVQG